MKKTNLNELFKHLNSKEVLLTDIKSDSADCDKQKIRNMTMEKIHQDMKQKKQFRFYRTLKRMAAGLAFTAILGGGAYAVASEELGWSIKKMFGLEEKEVQISEQQISTDDYALSVVDIAYDGNFGRVLIKLESLTDQAAAIIKQKEFPDITGCSSILYNKDLSSEKEAYYWIDVEGEERVNVKLPETDESLTILMEKTVESNSVSLGKSDFYTKLDYSPLGITIWAERTVDESSPEEPSQPNITFRYKNGKEEFLENISMQANTFGSDHYSCKAIHDNTFEGFRWIYGFSNRCDWSQIDAIGIDGVWYSL